MAEVPGILTLTWLRAQKLYTLAHAYESLVRVAVEVVDQLLIWGQSDAAAQWLAGPISVLKKQGANDALTLDVRGQYVRALCETGRIAEARVEMANLQPYLGQLSPEAHRDLAVAEAILGGA